MDQEITQQTPVAPVTPTPSPTTTSPEVAAASKPTTAAKIFGRGEPAATPAPAAPAGQGQAPVVPAPAEVTPATVTDPAAVQPAGLDAKSLVSALKEAGLFAQQPAEPGQPAQPQMTEQQMRQALNVYEPTAEIVEAIRQGGEPAVAALQQVVQGAVKQAVTLASLVLEKKMAEVDQRYSPAVNMAQEAQMKQQADRFFGKYPKFKGMEPLLMQIRDSMVARKLQFPNEEAAFEAVSQQADSILKMLPGGGNTPNTAGQQTQQPAGVKNQQPKPNMPTLSGKGTGGAPANGTVAKQSTAQKIFGRR